MTNGETIESYVPARLDGLPWSSWHWLIVVSLGATWILDGLEVTLAGALGGILTLPQTLGLTPARVGASATCYLAGAVLGALLFGYGTDRFGRKKLFFITVAVYLIGTALSAFSWNFWSYAVFRAITGAGIGGEYAAINSAIDELIPARVRGRVDLMINGSYWIGAAIGAAATLVLLDPRYIPIWLGWRCAFGIGATEHTVGAYLLPFALGNVLGPMLLGHLFDTIGRKQMITVTYGLAGVLLALTGWFFHAGLLTAQTQTMAWTVIFFVASAAASSAYLTVSEIFPLEIRAMAIAIFFAIGTLVGGVGAPVLFGWIIGTGSRAALFIGYLLAAALMIFGAAVEAWIGVAAERRSLEHVAAPLSSRGL